MKAFLLAAGYGTRLKPITDTLPKCLVPISGRPLLGWWLNLLKRHHIDEVLINTHYLSGQVEKYIASLNEEDMKIHLIYEPELLGSGGTVKNNIDFIQDERDFLICYADNLTCVDITQLISFHRSHAGILTMGLFYADNPSQCGIAVMDKEQVITEFVEKPAEPKSNLANAGIYVASRDIIRCFPDRPVFDFGHDVLPLLVNDMRGHLIKEYLLDIGTLDNYQKANKEWQNDYI